eukprot:GHUV01027853.1.p2 GENE.GHUV01027853.1~~GHUV01027853.1.p2  ORF type:complete len:108 (+),score=26.38 GHUV01027853.1:774-1097(+)
MDDQWDTHKLEHAAIQDTQQPSICSCRDMGHPNANADHLAPLLRDKLMPLRMWWLKHAPGAMSQFRKGLEHKKLGAPGGHHVRQQSRLIVPGPADIGGRRVALISRP